MTQLEIEMDVRGEELRAEYNRGYNAAVDQIIKQHMERLNPQRAAKPKPKEETK